MRPAGWLVLAALIALPARGARALPLHGGCLLEPALCLSFELANDDQGIALVQQTVARTELAVLPIERRVHLGPFPDVIGRRHLEEMQIQLIREMRGR